MECHPSATLAVATIMGLASAQLLRRPIAVSTVRFIFGMSPPACRRARHRLPVHHPRLLGFWMRLIFLRNSGTAPRCPQPLPVVPAQLCDAQSTTNPKPAIASLLPICRSAVCGTLRPACRPLKPSRRVNLLFRRQNRANTNLAAPARSAFGLCVANSSGASPSARPVCAEARA